ncbi:HNH endonuclease signature motif containing protein [Microbacterium caowuchunii]|uniref:DUF222 domain-containing protein n=1 Tax=Microbacterium caowuchunii TaxID=2614638 RepID=A0A5N0TGK1_9MICO|nr:HNH endonuclease signature motif containing protein [Microbacterium caowuchunii]KAA9132409.1 DUF222 domain-containing protein [Microbacterium caowuchunii]
MPSKPTIGFSDAAAAALADIVHEAGALQAAIDSAQAQLTRTFARASRLAEDQTRHASERVKARDVTLRGIAAEIAGVLRSTDRAVQRRISDAVSLTDGFPATLDAWEAGDITRAHVNLLLDIGSPLPPEARAEFEQAALRRCEEETAGRLRSELQILADRMHPRTLTERHAQAREDRCVTIFPLRDGTSQLSAVNAGVLVEAAMDRLTQQAREVIDARAQARERLKARADATGSAAVTLLPADDALQIEHDELLASDNRTIDQVRSDILFDMLLTAQPGADPTRTDDGPGTLGAIRAKVQVVVPALTLLGADEHPADLVGHAPIDADTARTLAGAVPDPWVRVLTHPVSGAVLASDTRFAEGPLRNFLKARDRHCRFPGCRVPAIRCEIDHTIDHARGGPTAVENCEALCQRHHTMKQFTAWNVRQLGDGVLEWTSPLGRTYIDEPPAPTVHFVPDADDPLAAPPPAPPTASPPTPPATRPPGWGRSLPPQIRDADPPPF